MLAEIDSVGRFAVALPFDHAVRMTQHNLVRAFTMNDRLSQLFGCLEVLNTALVVAGESLPKCPNTCQSDQQRLSYLDHEAILVYNARPPTDIIVRTRAEEK